MTIELEIPQWLLDNWPLVLLPLNWVFSLPSLREASRKAEWDSEAQRNCTIGLGWVFSPCFNILMSIGKTCEFLGKVVNWRNKA